MAEQPLFHVYPSKCTACKNCEFACSFSHGSDSGPTLTRIATMHDPDGREGKNRVVLCMQCDTAACVAGCPSNALWRNPETGAIYHVEDRCIRCRSCVAACPFGNMRWEAKVNFPVKCDLCNGDPVCVKFCPTRAIEYR